MNPEFRRNLWLECTPPRLVGAFTVLFALLALTWLTNGRGFGLVTEKTALACFVLFTLAWGAHLTSNSLLQELRSRTWDQQRMSSLSPWAMTWGKLLGAPAAAWACGAAWIVVYALSATLDANSLWILLGLASAAVGVHAFALIGGLLMAQRGQQAGQPVSNRVAAVLAVISLLRYGLATTGPDVTWYGVDYPRLPFLASVATVLAAWLVFGSYRLMCEELKVRTVPWALIGFIATLGVLVNGGLVTALEGPAVMFGTFLCASLALALAGAYLTAFAFAPDPLTPRRLRRCASEHRWRRLAEETPLWLASLACALVLAVLIGAGRVQATALPEAWVMLAHSPFALLLFAGRDLLVFYGIACRSPKRSNEATQLLYLALAYWLLPSILRLAGAGNLAVLLRPGALEGLPALAILLPQVLVAGWWARAGWRVRMGG